MLTHAVLSALLAAVTLPERAPSFNRRQAAAAAVAAASTSAASAKGTPPLTARTLSREEAIDALLSRVPAYVVTNNAGEPYLTEVDPEGRRSGSIFMGPRDAAQVLQEVRKYDTTATLAVVPLSTVYPLVAKTAADAARSRADAPQPEASTSTNMRLFLLRALLDEKESNEAAVSMLPGGSLLPGINLFFEPDLLIGSNTDPALRQRPYFFRLGDLNTVWRTGKGDDRNVGQISPSLRVVSLETLVSQVQSGSLDVPAILMPPSETADFDYR